MAAGSGAIALAAVLAACGGSGSSPTVVPPLSTTSSASATSAPAQDPKAAAVAVVREYFRLINNLDHDMNAHAFVAITTGGCPCRAFARQVREHAAKGEHYFGHIKLLGATPAADSPTQVQVLVSYDSSSGGTATDDGRVLYNGQPH